MSRRLPHGSVGDRFHLGDHERELHELIRERLGQPPPRRTIEEWQAFFQGLDRLEELLDVDEHEEHRNFLVENWEQLAALWNLTRREDLGGRRPLELYLRELLLRPDDAVDERKLDEDWGTKHVPCPHTYETMHPSLFTPEFLAFVAAGRPPHLGTRARWTSRRGRAG